VQDFAAIAGGFVIGRIERKRGIVSRERFLGPAKPLKCLVVERLGVTVAVSRRQVIGSERFLETAELLQNISSIELRFRIGRTAPGRFFISGESSASVMRPRLCKTAPKLNKASASRGLRFRIALNDSRASSG
jgi:hypothetical protein